MRQVNIHEAKPQLSRLVEDAARGDEIVIAKAGKPVARLVAVDSARTPRRRGLLEGKFKVPDDFDAPLPEDVLNLFEGRA